MFSDTERHIPYDKPDRGKGYGRLSCTAVERRSLAGKLICPALDL